MNEECCESSEKRDVYTSVKWQFPFQEYSPQLRDALGNADTTPYCETYLGYDGKNCSYLYFPIFDATDIRIYRQAPLPSLNEWYKQWRTNVSHCSRYYDLLVCITI